MLREASWRMNPGCFFAAGRPYGDKGMSINDIFFKFKARQKAII